MPGGPIDPLIIYGMLRDLAGAVNDDAGKINEIYRQLYSGNIGTVGRQVHELYAAYIHGDFTGVTRSQLDTDLNTLRAELAGDALPSIRDVLVELASGVAVGTLPTTPPAGYGADSVWGKVLAFSGDDALTADAALSMAGEFALNVGRLARFKLAGAPDFSVDAGGAWYFHSIRALAYDLPNPDYTAILPTDTVLSWLTRTEPNYTWQHDAGTDLCYSFAAIGKGGYHYYLWCDLHDADLLRLRQLQTELPPVWPGLDRVTLGTPADLARGLTITQPMHGVIVAISAVDPKQMYYTYDDLRAYRHIGALAFVDDRGDVEGWQSLGFVSAVYCCRSMSQAAAVKIMSANGTVGTATPWLRSS